MTSNNIVGTRTLASCQGKYSQLPSVADTHRIAIWCRPPMIARVRNTRVRDNFKFKPYLQQHELPRNTTPAKPREGRFGYIWFVCDLNFQGWCSKSMPKSNTHCACYIVDDVLTAEILTNWKMAASSVLTVN